MLLIAWCALSINPAAFQDAEINWKVPLGEVSPEDRRDILEVAKLIGINDPLRVSGDLGGCFWVRVESRPVVEDRRVRSLWGWMRKVQGPNCEPPASDSALRPRAGNWLAGLPLAYSEEKWRLRDGNWFVDVTFNDDVDYGTAERIIRAARTRRFVEFCSLTDPRPLDAGDISSLMLSPLPEDHGVYWVFTRPNTGAPSIGGITVHVTVSEMDVELSRCSSWLA